MPPTQYFVPDVNPAATAVPARGTVRVGYFWGLDTLVRKRGGNPSLILQNAGLDPTLFDDPDNTMRCMDLIDLLARCSDTLEDPLFGMHLAAEQEPEVFGCVIALAQSAPTFGDALRCLIDYIPVSASPECELELASAGEWVELRWRSLVGFGTDVQTGLHGLLIIFKTLQLLNRGRFQARYATLHCAIGRTQREPIQRHLGCRVQGSAEHNAIAFPAASLQASMPSSNRLSFYLLSQGLNQLRASSKEDFVASVRACIRQKLGSGQCTVGHCADKLCTSTRTLQKRLNRLGIRFSDLVLEERIEQARQALRWTDHSLDEIAYQLGYAEQTSFGRAFKMATGFTPKAYRSAKRKSH